jgi:Uma2 family endonuclease
MTGGRTFLSIAGPKAHVRQYLDAGAKLVWVLDPEKSEIDVYPQGGALYTLTAEDNLEAPDILPGFSVPVGKLFE